MRIGIISDIHSNAEALDRVLGYISKINKFICLGDIVGYGADPNYCINKVRKLKSIDCLAGNHDFGAIGRINIDYFNYEAKQAILWTTKNLNNSSQEYLSSLPEEIILGDEILAVHGSPLNPVWEYVLDSETASIIFKKYHYRIFLVGHTHLAGYFSFDEDNEKIEYTDLKNGGSIEIKKDKRYIINCGSVGQPRDGNPQASYGIYDLDRQRLIINRISYPVYITQKKILNAGLPKILAERLDYGI